MLVCVVLNMELRASCTLGELRQTLHQPRSISSPHREVSVRHCGENMALTHGRKRFRKEPPFRLMFAGEMNISLKSNEMCCVCLPLRKLNQGHLLIYKKEKLHAVF